LAGFTFVGRRAPIAGFRGLLERRKGELLVVSGKPGCGKSHLLRRLRREAESTGSHFVQLCDLSFLPNAAYRHYAIIAELAAAHAARSEGEDGKATGPELLPDPEAFLAALLAGDRRPPQEKLLQVFSAASGHLEGPARLVLLLDLGQAVGEEAFPLEFLARRLPDKVKLVAAVPGVPGGLRQLDSVTVVDGLPDLTEAEVADLLAFHLPKGAATAELVHAVAQRYPREPMAVDLAAKIGAMSPNPAQTLTALPTSVPELCEALLAQLDPGQRGLVEAIARVPSGVDIACLRAVTEFSDAELGRLLRSEGIRNTVITQRGARGPEAGLCHELLAEAVLAASPSGPAETRTFHRLAAGFFLSRLQRDPADAVALAAHGHHLRLADDKGLFIEAFPRTYRAKHSFRLFEQLAEEYRLLLRYCDEMGETAINRPACLANLGRVYQELGQYDDALACHRAALALCEQAEDPAGQAEQLANLATALQAQGQREEAIAHLQRAVTLDQETGNEPALAADLNNLGILLQQAERYDDALACHRRALALHQQTGNDLGCANQLANMAAIHRARGDRDAACECYQKAWALDSRTGNVLAQITDLCNLGRLFADMGEMGKAIASYQNAIDLDRQVADREAEAAHLRTLADLHAQTGQTDEALALLAQALELDSSLGNKAGEAEDLAALAQAHRAAGALNTAREHAERAAALHADLGNDADEAAARRLLDAIDRQLRGEAIEEEVPPDEKPPQHEQDEAPILQRAPAEDLWANLEIVDDDRPGATAPTAEPAPANGTDAGVAFVEGELALCDNGAPAPEPSDNGRAEARTPLAPASEVEDALRRELDAALKRVADLEAELKEYKALVDSLRSIVGDVPIRK